MTNGVCVICNLFALLRLIDGTNKGACRDCFDAVIREQPIVIRSFALLEHQRYHFHPEPGCDPCDEDHAAGIGR